MIKTRTNNAFFRQLLFLAVLITIGLIIFHQLAFFVGSFLGAVTLYVVLRPLFFNLTEKRGWKPGITSFLLVVGMSLVVLGLGYLIFEVIASEISSLDTSRLMKSINTLPNRINHWLGYQVITSNLWSQSAAYLTRFFSSILNTTYSFAANIFMMMVILFFMLFHARSMEQKLFSYLPFSGNSLGMIQDEFQNMIYSNAIGIPVVMISQALAAALVYWAVGLNNVVFWAFLTALCGLLPMVGTVIVSLPLGIYLLVGGDIWQGIVVIACGLLIIANVDNLCRIVMMQKIANTHPLIVIFGVILGIPLFGFWGIIFGPLLLSSFLLLIKIYYLEYDLISLPKIPEQQEMPSSPDSSEPTNAQPQKQTTRNKQKAEI